MPAQSWAQPKTLAQWLLFKIFAQKVFETNLNFRCPQVRNLKKYSHQVGFPTGQDSAIFGTKGHKFLHVPGQRDKRDKLKILPKDRTGQDSLSRSKAQHGRDSVSHPVPRDKTGQSRKGQSKTGKGPSRASNSTSLISFYFVPASRLWDLPWKTSINFDHLIA